MLINLSNHPSEKWSQQQLDAAKCYGTVVDLPFPVIDPMAESFEIDKLSAGYLNQIDLIFANDIKDQQAVHIMGELTFSFSLVNKLRAKGIACLASTTQRIVNEEDNLKMTEFQFCRFRNYK